MSVLSLFLPEQSTMVVLMDPAFATLSNSPVPLCSLLIEYMGLFCCLFRSGCYPAEAFQALKAQGQGKRPLWIIHSAFPSLPKHFSYALNCQPASMARLILQGSYLQGLPCQWDSFISSFSDCFGPLFKGVFEYEGHIFCRIPLERHWPPAILRYLEHRPQITALYYSYEYTVYPFELKSSCQKHSCALQQRRHDQTWIPLRLSCGR